jgi:alpha-D-ribose 1-methylphosphonate 5-triphosphate diphosphatase PhnM
MDTKNFIFSLIAIILSCIFTGLAVHEHCYKIYTKDLHSYQEYYQSTEVLLDSISTWQPGFENIEESDAYQEYALTRESLPNVKF